jgi:hypothetical protein
MLTHPGHEKGRTMNLSSIAARVKARQQVGRVGITLQVKEVAEMIAEIERLRALVSKMQDCIAETLESAEEA